LLSPLFSPLQNAFCHSAAFCGLPLCYRSAAALVQLGFSYMIVFDMGVYSSMGEMVFISALELVMFFGTIQKLHEEIIEIMNEGIDVYLLPRSLIENACSFCTCASFVLMFISRHSFQSMVLEHALRVLIAISGWTYMFW